MEQVFVAREQQLAQLQSFLDQTLAGHGQICFVTGEAGAGKTALVTEFARRAQAQHDDLLVAIGNCNAQAGIGDPYLPFREVLSQLTGNVDASTVSAENANRLQSFLRVSGKALVELGPDLIDVFVPGAGLATRAAALLAGKFGWTEQLQELTQRQARVGGESGLEQRHIFEQYTNVLKAMAAERPLALVVDDLQWADADSISLLFHISRRIETGRVLIVGTYRPEEVALGRASPGPDDTGRHPLEKVLNEIQRYWGNVVVDLGRDRKVEGREFVDALLDAEPNLLGEDFRAAFLGHTLGHPLFAVELLRAMQERGGLVQDGAGRWIAGPSLDWDSLPARVEGVIAERIGRLKEELRETLTVASVEGEDFTAELVARVRAVDERGLVRQLSGELEKQHRLVHAQGMRRLGRQRLSLFRFRHNLFQKYLYNNLNEVERAYLHEDVGNVLEELYGAETQEVAVQLARHFVEAGVSDKAVTYLFQAGERARRLYANDEARSYYRRALALIETVPPDALPLERRQDMVLQLHHRLGDVFSLAGEQDAARNAYRRALDEASNADRVLRAQLHRKIGNTYQVQRRYDEAFEAWNAAQVALGARPADDTEPWWQAWVQIQLDRLWVYYLVNAVPEIARLVEDSRALVEQHGAPTQRAAFFVRLVLLGYRRDRYVISEETLQYAQAAFDASRDSENLTEAGFAQFVLGFTYLWYGDLDRAEEQMLAGLELAERIGDVVLQSRYLTYLTVIYRKRGQVEQTEHFIARSLDVAATGEMLEYIATAKANQAWVAWRKGDLADVQARAQAALEEWSQQPMTFPLDWLARGPLLGAALRRDEVAAAVEHAQAMLSPSQQILPDAVRHELEAAVESWESGEPEQARVHLERAAIPAQEMGYL